MEALTLALDVRDRTREIVLRNLARLKLVHLFTARLWSSPADLKGTHTITYQKLREVAERTDAEAEVGQLALS